MQGWLRRFLTIVLVSLLLGCNGNTEVENRKPDTAAPPAGRADQESDPEPAGSAGRAEGHPLNQGGIRVTLHPARPSSSDCLRAVVQGRSGGAPYHWLVNGNPVPDHQESVLCSEHFKRDDQVMVQVGLDETAASDTLTIGNTPPRILEVSATSDQVLRHGPITVSAVADDLDGDLVEFRYQWLINGEEDHFSTEATLPAENYAQGDRIKVKIVPFDGIDEGTIYESAELTVNNAPPVITSRPPVNFEAWEYLYQVEASDPDGQELAYTLQEAPEGMTISDAGLISWDLAEVAAGTYRIEIAVEDADSATAHQKYTLNLGERR